MHLVIYPPYPYLTQLTGWQLVVQHAAGQPDTERADQLIVYQVPCNQIALLLAIPTQRLRSW